MRITRFKVERRLDALDHQRAMEVIRLASEQPFEWCTQGLLYGVFQDSPEVLDWLLFGAEVGLS